LLYKKLGVVICINDNNILESNHNGIVFDKLLKNDGLYYYMVYLEDLKMLSRIIITENLDNYSSYKFKMYLFEDEDKVQRKIRIQKLND